MTIIPDKSYFAKPQESRPNHGGAGEKCIVALHLPQWNNRAMIIGDRLREMREAKTLSQGDIEKRTGLLRCYISRVENGHAVPALETLEKMARALEVPMYRLFHDGEVAAGLSKLKPPKEDEFGSKGAQADYFSKF